MSKRHSTPFHSLREFLIFLEQERELLHITAPIDPVLEATEISIRSLRHNGPALFFDNPVGSTIPLVMNILGTERRIELALGIHPYELGQKLIGFAEQLISFSPKISLGNLAVVRRALAFRQERSRRAPSYEVIEPPSLSLLPILKCWPEDGGKFITLPQVITEDPLTHRRNVGMYRMQIFDETTTGMHWQIQKGGGFHYAKAEKNNQPLPVAVAIGTDPALLLATVAPLPEGIDEMGFAGFLRGDRTRITRAKTVPLDVPAEAEIILEGYVSPFERRREGPFGDHFGHYSSAAEFPVFHIRTMAHRKNPIYAATVVGKPPMEDKYLGNAAQEILSPLIRLLHPEIKNLWAYYEAGFHNLLIVSVDERYQKEAMKTALSIVGEGQLSLTKCVITVSGEIDVRDFHAVLREIRDWFDPHEDFILIPKVPLDTLDFTSLKMNLGSKIILDATKKPYRTAKHKKDGASPGKRTSKRITHLLSLQRLRSIDRRILDWNLLEESLLVVTVKSAGRAVLRQLLREKMLSTLKIIAAVSPDVNIHQDEELIWGIFTRFDGERDVLFSHQALVGIAPVYYGPMGIDGTWKKGYPEPLTMSEEIIKKVDEKWNSLKIESHTA